MKKREEERREGERGEDKERRRDESHKGKD
jgi:hypothetical protein